MPLSEAAVDRLAIALRRIDERQRAEAKAEREQAKAELRSAS